MTTRRLLLAAVAVFVLAALVPSTGLFNGSVGGDSSVYQAYGQQIVHGHVPYHDFFMEYPPGAIPAFVLPDAAGAGHYVALMKLLMLACMLGILVLASVSLRRIGADRMRTIWTLGLLALAPLLLGPVLTTHYDPWPALLTALALTALLADRRTLAFAALGVAAAAKVYPVVLVPLFVLYVLRRNGRRAAWHAVAALGAAFLVVLLPFVAVGAGGVRYSLLYESRRPLQNESLGAALLLAADHLGLYGTHTVQSYGSLNLVGSLPSALAAVSTVLVAAALVAIWLLFARGPRDGEALILASAATVVAAVAFGKVLSPQYLVWLLPLVPLAAGEAGELLVAALVLTQLIRIWPRVGVNGSAWVVLGRDAILVWLFAALLVPLVRTAGHRAHFRTKP